MKRITKILSIVAITLLLTASTSSTPQPQPERPKQVEVYNAPPLNLQFIREGTPEHPIYLFVGMIQQCNQLIDVSRLEIYSEIDSSRLPTQYVDGAMELINDSCAMEMFAFRVDGNAFRKQLWKIGVCTILIHGNPGVLFLTLTESGEEKFLEVLLLAPPDTI